MQKLKKNKRWLKAKKIIPGGNMLISKRTEFILPDYWPSYYKKAKDCFVWDLDNNKYLDMFFSPGTNILGYSNYKVDKDVISAIKKCNISTLNSYEEYLLANKLIKFHKWAKMVKFARSGGEVNAIAIRIARAAAFKKRTNIAFCGYHGWHDWYMSSLLNKKDNLKNHLITGIDDSGLPKQLKNSSFPFEYNNINQLKKLITSKNIGIVKMEVKRNFNPKDNFLKKVRKLCDEKKIILIFDECTSGFRETIGGLHLNYKVFPDLLILGKAMGNGYPITAVLGKKNIMKFERKTFISSTFWTERLGYVAALSTLKFMQKNKSQKKINLIGKYIKTKWEYLAKKYDLKIRILGLDAIPNFNFIDKFNQKAITYITQEMLKEKILASNVIYVSIAHKKKYVDKYLRKLEKIFKFISSLKNKNDISKFLKSKERQSELKRYN